jgi:hypothetical protein
MSPGRTLRHVRPPALRIDLVDWIEKDQILHVRMLVHSRRAKRRRRRRRFCNRAQVDRAVRGGPGDDEPLLLELAYELKNLGLDVRS